MCCIHIYVVSRTRLILDLALITIEIDLTTSNIEVSLDIHQEVGSFLKLGYNIYIIENSLIEHSSNFLKLSVGKKKKNSYLK